MARPTKEGLDYFPLDVGIFEDEKIEAIAGEFGIKGELTVIKLLCAVYRKGYFIVWNDLTKATLLKRLPGVSKEMLNQIVNRLVLWGFFDKELFDSVKVLTSENIQATFFEATKRRKTPKPTKYIINVNSNSQSETVNDDINAQSKVKESKINKSKVNKEQSGSKLAVNEGVNSSTTPKMTKFAELESDFEKLWELYPRKERKADALKAYKRAIKAGITNKEIQTGIIAYKNSIVGKDPTYIAQGGTWFTQQRWEDELTTDAVQSSLTQYNLDEVEKAYEQ